MEDTEILARVVLYCMELSELSKNDVGLFYFELSNFLEGQEVEQTRKLMEYIKKMNSQIAL